MFVRITKIGGWLLALCAISACTVAPTTVQTITDQPQGHPKTAVQYSGFVFMGEAVDIPKRYPFSHQVLEQSRATNQTSLDALLLAELQKRPPQHIELSTANTDSNRSGLAFALALSQEQTQVDQLTNSRYKVLIELSAQLLIIDFSNLTVVAAYPLSPVQFTDSNFASPPTEQQITTMFADLYKGTREEVSDTLFSEAAKRLSTVVPHTKNTNSLQVTQVEIAPKAETVLAEFNKEQSVVKTWLAQTFGAFLSTNQGVSMLPYTKDYAIGNRMTASFANGEVYTLSIPEPEYAIALDLRAMLSNQGKQKAQAMVYKNATYHGVTVSETFDNTEYLNARFKHELESKIPVGQEYKDRWTPYVESILNFYQELSIQLGNPRGPWIKQHSPSGTANLKQFKQVKTEVLERSR